MTTQTRVPETAPQPAQPPHPIFPHSLACPTPQVSMFDKGTQAWILILEELGKLPPGSFGLQAAAGGPSEGDHSEL